MPKQYYQIGKIKTVVEYVRYNTLGNGQMEIKHYQTLEHNGLKTMDELKELAQNRIAPGEDIEVIEAPSHE